eukprot:ANDGO_04302.mRNA.1 hypothetical protein
MSANEHFDDDYVSDEDYSSDDAAAAVPVPRPAAPSIVAGSKLSMIPNRTSSSVDSASGDADPSKQKVKVEFVLPADSRKRVYEVSMADTVEYLKLRLQEDEESCPYDRVSLFFNGRILPDPLSLVDIGSFNPQAVNVVQVQLA